MSASALPGENKTNKILYFCPREHYYLIKIWHQNNFFTFLSPEQRVYPIIHFTTAYSKKSLKCQPITWRQAQRWFLVSLTAVSMMFCFRPIQNSAVTFWIHQYSWKLSSWHSASWQSDSVIDWLFGATGQKI